MNNANTSWFVLYTKSRHEKKILHELNAKKIEGFLPTIRRFRMTGERRRSIETPLFPSYVFVQLADRASYIRTLEIEGVLYYVRAGDKIAIVDEEIIKKLKISTKDGSMALEITSEKICPGTPLLITAGPLVGMPGEAVKYKGRDKLIVRIDLLKRSILLDLAIENATVLASRLRQ